MSNNFKPRDPDPIPVDPNLAQAQADAKEFKTKTLQEQLRGDSASIMARYGTNLALAGSAGSPVAATPAAPSPAPAPFTDPMASWFR